LATNLKSTTETFGVGTRIAEPSSLPLSSGSTRPTALAAPVVVGIIDSGRGAGPIKVLVQRVERRLVAGVGVDRRHEAVIDADRVVEHLGDRRQAVGRARGVGDDEVIFRQLAVIDAVDNREVGALRPEPRLTTRLAPRVRCIPAFSRAVKMPVHSSATSTPERLVRQLGRILDRRHLDLLAVDDEEVAVGRPLRGGSGHARCRKRSRWAFVSTGPRSLIETTSMSLRPDSAMARSTSRPMASEPVDRNLYRHLFTSS